jgi:hypothetical protein
MAILALQVYDWQSGMKTLSSRQWFQKKTWPVADVSGILLVKIERTMLLSGLLIACARFNPGEGYGMQAIGCRLWDAGYGMQTMGYRKHQFHPAFFCGPVHPAFADLV